MKVNVDSKVLQMRSLSCCALLIYLIPCLSDVPLLLVVSLDGFWYKYLTLYNTPNLNALARQGVRAEFMKNVFVTKTYPNHFSIATGYYEEIHGVVGNAMYDPNLNETFDIANAETKWWDNGKVIPIWSANELQNASRHSGAIMWPGSDVEIHGDTIDHVITYNPNMSFILRVDTVISWFLHPYSPANCIFLYYEEPDATGHNFGPFSPEVRKKVESMDALIGHMVEKLKVAGIFDRLNLVVLSDHGMAEVPGKNVINMDDILDPKTYIKSGTSPVWNILPVEGKVEFVYNRLKAAANRSHFSVYRAEEVPTWYHYSRNPRILAVVVVADEGWDLSTTSTAYMRANRTYGNHGYDNRLDSMHPLFIARGPDFRVGYVSEPFNNVDLYPLMCYLLEIPVQPSNGSLDRVIFLLRRGSTRIEHDAWLVCVTGALVPVSIGLLVAVIYVSRRAKRLRKSMLEGTFALLDTPWRGGSTDEHQHLLVDDQKLSSSGIPRKVEKENLGSTQEL